MQLRVKLRQEIRGALLLKSEIKRSRKDRPGLSIPLPEVRLRQARKGKRPPECNLRQKALRRRAPPVRVRPKSHPHLDVTRVALRKGVPPQGPSQSLAGCRRPDLFLLRGRLESDFVALRRRLRPKGFWNLFVDTHNMPLRVTAGVPPTAAEPLRPKQAVSPKEASLPMGDPPAGQAYSTISL